MKRVFRRSAGAAIAAWTLAAPPARADDLAPTTQSNEAADSKAIEQGGHLTKTLVDPDNGGVGGTGLGKMSTAGKSGIGTGKSVKGPPGTGVDPNAPKPSP